MYTFLSRHSSPLSFVLLFLCLLILKGWPVPSGNEYTYLTQPLKQWHTNYLLNDWTYSRPSYTHFVFNFVAGLLTLVLPLELVGWLGRILCWSLIITALLRVGRHFQIPRGLTTISILCWLLYGQSVVAGEWIVGTFEAKSVAYVFLLFALDAFFQKRDTLASILLGLTFSFHPAVGLWSGLAIASSLVLLRYPPKTLLSVAGYTTLFALPGLIALLPALLAPGAGSAEDWKFMVLFRSPNTLDPLSWPKRDILNAYILLLFNWLHFRTDSQNQTFRFLISFQLLLAFFFSLGLLARLTEAYIFLRLMPFRLFPVFTLLLFFFHLMNAYHHYTPVKRSSLLAAVGFLALLTFNNPLGSFVDQARGNRLSWTQEQDAVSKAFVWLARHTPNGVTAILPPWRSDGFYLSQRAQIGAWRAIPDDRLTEWRERLEALVGPNFVQPPNGTLDEVMEAAYSKLPEADIASVVRKYGGDYLISKAQYPYPVLFDSGTYRVYSLKGSDAAKQHE